MMESLIPQFDYSQWVLVILCALVVGMAKAGIAGLGMVPILLMAEVVPGRASSGALLLLLIVGDCFAVRAFHQHTVWSHLRKVLPPAIVGVVIGWLLMGKVSDSYFRPLIGWITLILTLLHVVRKRLGTWVESTYHSHAFAWTMGGTGGVTTMLANAAGPVMTMFFLAMNLPKYEFVATNAWFFFIINLFKVPFSVGLGLISVSIFMATVLVVPVVYCGIFSGKWLLQRLPEKLFQFLIVTFSIIGSLRLILG